MQIRACKSNQGTKTNSNVKLMKWDVFSTNGTSNINDCYKCGPGKGIEGKSC